MDNEHAIVLDAAFRASSLPTLIVDTGTRVVAANPAYVTMTGRDASELAGAFTIDFVHADDLETALAGLDRLLSGEPAVKQRRRHLRGDGTWINVTSLTSHFEVDRSRYLLVQILQHDAPGLPRGGEVLNQVRTRTQLQPFGDASCFHDRDGKILLTPRGLAADLGRSVEWLFGRRFTDPEMGAVDASGAPLGADDDPVLAALRDGDDVTRTIGFTSAAGRIAWYSIRAGVVDHLDTVMARSTLRRVDDLVEAQHEIRASAAMVEQELAHRLDHDDLTGLKTRRALIELTEAALWSGGPVGLVFVDLDRFKEINDELGHLAGDEVLAATALVLYELAPAAAVLGRAGGDEFVLLTRGLDDAHRFAAAVTELSEGPSGLVTVRGFPVRASVGVADSVPGDSRSDLFARADRAMYDVKSARSGR